MLRALTFVAALALTGQSAVADILLVPSQHPTIMGAVAAAQNGDTILIADGVYTEDVTIQGKTLVLTSESTDPSACVIEGNSVSVLLLGGLTTVTMKGIGITGDGSAQGVNIGPGGTMFMEQCTIFETSGIAAATQGWLSMTDCTIRDCVGVDAGGGLLVLGGTATLVDCVIEDNELTSPTANGAGIAVNGGSLTLIDTDVLGNFATGGATEGGGLWALNAEVVITGGEITGNDLTGGGVGGGLSLDGAQVSIHNASIRHNEAGQGGGIHAVNGSVLRITDTLVGGNIALSGGGGGLRAMMSTFDIDSCTIVNNTAAGGPGAIGTGAGSTTTMTNSIVDLNSQPDFGGAGVLDVTYSNVPSGVPGAGNITTSPMFEAPLLGNYRLAMGSPAIDAGDTTRYGGVGVDRDGAPRVVDVPGLVDTGVAVLGAPIDMGAFEFQVAVTPEPDTCPADVDGGGTVGFEDLVAVLAAWGGCP